jgi:uncharacterized membrane protein YkoI
MKKINLAIFCGTVFTLATLLPISSFAAASGAEQYIGEAKAKIEYYKIPSSSSESIYTEQYISKDKAKSAALEHAGVAPGQATFIKTHLDHDNGHVVYEVEFYYGDTEYDYEIDAVSGETLESDMEIEYYSIPRITTAASSGTGSYIGEEKAKSIALESAGLSESEVTRTKVKFDRDDGKTVYEVDFHNGRMEYEYEIDAVSGAILESDAEFDD